MRTHGLTIAWPPALVWMGLLFYLSSIPNAPQPFTFDFGDKISHALAFGFLACLLVFARLPYRTGSISRAALITGIVLIYGITDEIHQSFVPGRNASVGDVVADGIGGLVAAFFLVWLQRRPWQ